MQTSVATSHPASRSVADTPNTPTQPPKPRSGQSTGGAGLPACLPCVRCGATAFYRVGETGYCGRHRDEAYAAARKNATADARQFLPACSHRQFRAQAALLGRYCSEASAYPEAR